MINTTVTDILRCPECCAVGLVPVLAEAENGLKGSFNCQVCATQFPVQGGIPYLIPKQRTVGERWNLWWDHLEIYQARDQFRRNRPSESRERRYLGRMKAFSEFMDVQGENVLLDIGCGSGKFRFWFDDQQTTYIGIDPLWYAEAADFAFVQAIAEFLPFQDGTFRSVVVRSALDHFCDLDAFLREACRVLRPGGRLYLEQSIHELTGPISAVKTAAHVVKDWVDVLQTSTSWAIPKHMNYFTTRTVRKSLSKYFELERVQEFSSNSYTPTQLFMVSKPKAWCG